MPTFWNVAKIMLSTKEEKQKSKGLRNHLRNQEKNNKMKQKQEEDNTEHKY